VPSDPSQPQTQTGRRCGYVAILGLPNAGKSTLLNRLTGTKLSIVTPKPQTTRFRVAGAVISGGSQILFLDLPGIFAANRRLERAMVQAAWKGATDADILLMLIDAARGLEPEAREVLERLHQIGRPILVALNKIDVIAKEKLLPLAAELSKLPGIEGIFMISALAGDGVRDLLLEIAGRLPAGPWLYPEDHLTDLPERLLAAEIVREQLFLQLRQELPYSVTVETESWKDLKDGAARIEMTVLVEREGQRGIVLGAGGQQIKAIGQAARAGLERLLDRRVHLFLHVKVRPEWREEAGRFRDVGLEFEPKEKD
jgi:GTPase